MTVFSVEYDQMARHLPTVLFITYAKISTHPVLLTYAKILWTHADHATHKIGVLETYKTNYIPKLNFLMSENIGQRKLNSSGTFFLP